MPPEQVSNKTEGTYIFKVKTLSTLKGKDLLVQLQFTGNNGERLKEQYLIDVS